MDVDREGGRRNFVALAVAFEGGLGVLATVLGWWTGPLPWSTVADATPGQLWRGVVAGAALAAVFFALVVFADRYDVGMFKQLRRTVRDLVVPLFRGVGMGGLMVISGAAGLGEELLFRGYCQAALAHWHGPPWGDAFALIVASLLFGVCHWISPAYALVAAVMGFALGGLFLVTGNVVAPVVAHALYDFLVLYYLCREEGAAR